MARERIQKAEIIIAGLTISISLISVDEVGFSKLSIGYEFEAPVLTESLRIELYPSSSTSVLSRSVRIFCVMLIAVDIARKSAVIDVVPTPPTTPPPAPTA